MIISAFCPACDDRGPVATVADNPEAWLLWDGSPGSGGWGFASYASCHQVALAMNAAYAGHGLAWHPQRVRLLSRRGTYQYAAIGGPVDDCYGVIHADTDFLLL